MNINNNLREALKLCVDEMCNRCRDLAAARGDTMPCLSGCEPVRKAKAALAAPPRNCDLYATAEEAAEAWHKHEAEDTGEEYCAGCPFNLGEDCVRGGVCSIGWIYAEGQEGGAK